MIITQPSCNDINEPGLKPVSEALQFILKQLDPIQGTQRLPIERAKGRILAEPLKSPINVPAYNNSAVDGYAFRHAEQNSNCPTQFQVEGISYAGHPYGRPIPQHRCLRIMTGAALPPELDTVIMQEQVTFESGHITFDRFLPIGSNVRNAGEDIKRGDTVLNPGRYLTAPDIGLAASLGIAEIAVMRPLKVGIASTGSELIDPGCVGQAEAIFDSNRYSLLAVLDNPRIETIDLGILPDQPNLILEALEAAADYVDIIITSGGVSVGDADYTKTALQQAGTVNLWKVAIKPGRPLAFGNFNDKPFFGLPGNPVAVWVTFYQFVRPSIEKLLNQQGKPVAPIIKAISLERLRKKPGRTEIQRGILELSEHGDWTVRSTGKQGSGRLSSMSSANAFIILNDDSGTVEIGDRVTVQPFSGLF